MNPRARKLLLTTHITVSMGWIGAALAYLALVIVAMTGSSDSLLRAIWMALELIGWYVIVPLAALALVSGIAIALGTPWGLFRHYWVVASLVLTAVATGVLVKHMLAVSPLADIAADAARTDAAGMLRAALRSELVHAGIGLVLLVAIESLNVFKPRGLTAYGRMMSREAVSDVARVVAAPEAARKSAAPWPRWAHVVWIHAVALLLLLGIIHAAGGGLRLH